MNPILQVLGRYATETLKSGLFTLVKVLNIKIIGIFK